MKGKGEIGHGQNRGRVTVSQEPERSRRRARDVYSCCVRALAADCQLTAVHLLAAVVSPRRRLAPLFPSSSSLQPSTHILAHICIHCLCRLLSVWNVCLLIGSMENNSVEKECALAAKNWKEQGICPPLCIFFGQGQPLDDWFSARLILVMLIFVFYCWFTFDIFSAC